MMSPSLRSARANPTSTETSSDPAAISSAEDVAQVVPHQLEVVVLLDDGAERVLGDLAGERPLPEVGDGPGPVDGLRDARPLRQVELPQLLDGHGDPAGELLRHLGSPDHEDLGLPAYRREVDPV